LINGSILNEHNIESGPPKDHPIQVMLNSV